MGGCEPIEPEPEDCDDTMTEASAQCMAATLQPGTSLIASGYCLYSSSTFFCLTLGAGVQMFTLDTSIGEFVLTHPNVKVPDRGSIYSMNEANRPFWDPPLRAYVEDIQRGKGESEVTYTSRYIGSMVGDVHRTLLYGGLFGYPADGKNHRQDAHHGLGAAERAPAHPRHPRLARRCARVPQVLRRLHIYGYDGRFGRGARHPHPLLLAADARPAARHHDGHDARLDRARHHGRRHRGQGRAHRGQGQVHSRRGRVGSEGTHFDTCEVHRSARG